MRRETDAPSAGAGLGSAATALRDPATRAERVDDARPFAEQPIIIATVARERGITGVHTHVRQLRKYLDRPGRPPSL